jgi:hypothetical protein
MKRFSFKRMRWFKRKPKTVCIVCRSCQQQAVGVRNGDATTTSPIVGPEMDAARQMVAQQAVNSLNQVDALRRQQATGEPLRDQALSDIQAGFTQNVLDVARRLRRPGGPGDSQ